MTTRVVIADDHGVVRAGIVALLSACDAVVVGETGDGLEALALVGELAPDVLVVDLMLPGLSGSEVTRRVAATFPATRILVLTLHDDDAYAARAHRDGAAGFVSKGADPRMILRAFEEVAAGGSSFPRRVAAKGLEPSDPWVSLTDREREIAQLISEGWTHADVGERLGISKRTVEVHRGNVMRKLRLAGTPELVRYMIRVGNIEA